MHYSSINSGSDNFRILQHKHAKDYMNSCVIVQHITNQLQKQRIIRSMQRWISSLLLMLSSLLTEKISMPSGESLFMVGVEKVDSYLIQDKHETMDISTVVAYSIE
jgi:hypothetical protein